MKRPPRVVRQCLIGVLFVLGATASAWRTLELRLEAFNLLNNFNWGNPISNYDSGSFGQINSLGGDPRIMQFGVKYGF